MSFNLYDLESELNDKNAVDFTRKAILYDYKDMNKVIPGRRERLNHFSTKAIMFYILQELDHDVVTEVEIVGVGRVDLYDITTKTVYEFETNVSPKYRKEANEKYIQAGVEVIVININELPDDIFQRYLKLREFVIPD